MRRIAVLIVCSGACSFTPGTYTINTTVDDADAADDAPALADASIDERPAPGPDAMWVDVETLQVPCLSATVTSTTTLAAGVTYRLRASGTCVIGSNILGDAEYWNFNNGQNNDIAANGVIDIGLAIDDPVMDLPKQPKWGAYTASHVYVLEWMGNGARIDALYHEQGPANNTGTIELVIQSFQ